MPTIVSVRLRIPPPVGIPRLNPDPFSIVPPDKTAAAGA